MPLLPPPPNLSSFEYRVISAQTLLFSSTFFHLTECMGPKTWLVGVRMDYTSISVLIVGSYFPCVINMQSTIEPLSLSLTRALSF
jgi:predicted membrane channel-forming protein YqfA (hemolysin III family)